MKKRPFSKLISLLLAALLLVSMSVVTVSAYASGAGTQADPYLITSAKELQNVNSDLSASYKLAANIDLKGVDFVPLGNAENGAFTGTFDGAGFTIYNLDIHSGKYAGLFGYNEGVIKNVTLDNISVCGNRYIGGVCAQNAEDGTLENCSVLGGQITSEDGLYDIFAGGIIGLNEGQLNTSFTNKADISIDSLYNIYIGGIIGDNTAASTIKAQNYGKISCESSNDYGEFICGGIIGDNAADSVIKAQNYGKISCESSSYYGEFICGGITGNSQAALDIEAKNFGDISGNFSYHCDSYIGGIVGYCFSGDTLTIAHSSNNGNINLSAGSFGNNSTGGILGATVVKTSIYNCYNSGNIICDDYTSVLGGIAGGGSIVIENAVNTGILCGANYTGGIVSWYASDSKLVAYNCYNTGNMISDYDASGISLRESDISNCYQSAWTNKVTNRFGITPAYNYHDSEVNNSYTLFAQNYTYQAENSCGKLCTAEELRQQSTYNTWNFEDIWQMDARINSGFPTLRNMPSALMLNISSAKVLAGTELKLTAFKDGVETSNVDWSVTYGSATVSQDGTVKLLSNGLVTVTAKDKDGYQANCSICVYTPAASQELSSATINATESDGSIELSSLTQTWDHVVEYYSSNDSVVEAGDINSYILYYHPVAAGTAVLTVKMYGGATITKKVTVTDYAGGISFDSSATIVSKGSQKQIDYSTDPDPTSSKITWTSSNNDVATVDQNGVVTGVSVGQAVITATTDNGYSDTCTVTVNAPVTSMHFERPSVTVYKNDTDKLNLITDPADTTDTISYSSSSSSRVSVSSDGTITAGSSTGTATITATSSSGVKAYCTVTVIDQPVPVESVSLNENSKSLQVEEVFKLTASVLPETATNQTVTWRSTDDSVASVNGDGTVTAVGAGKAVITAEAENGALDYCEITVTGPNSKNLSKIYVPDVVQADGDAVTVPVLIEHNPGISFASLTVAYDPAVLQPLSVTNGVVFDSVLGSIEAGNNIVKLCFTSEENVTADGALAYIRFQVVGDLFGQTPVSVRYFPDEIRNAASEPVAFNLLDGMIDVDHEPSENVMGDVDGNGLINAADAVLVLRHDAGLIQLTAQQLAAADVSQDGVVNASDAVQILRYDAGLITKF